MEGSHADDFGDNEDFGLAGGGEGSAAHGGLQAHNSLDLYSDVQDAAGVGAPGALAVNREQDTMQAPTQPAAAPSAPAPAQAAPQNAGSTAVYVGGLQWWTTDAELDALCRPYGELISLRFFEDKGNGKSKGYALANFATAEAALRCKEGLNGHNINGKKCVVTSAAPAAAPGAARAGGTPGHGSGGAPAGGDASLGGQGGMGRDAGRSAVAGQQDAGASAAGQAVAGDMRGSLGMPPGMPHGMPAGMPMPPGMMPMMPGMGIPGLVMPGMMMPGMGGMRMPILGMPAWGGQGPGTWRGGDNSSDHKRPRY